MIKTLVAVFLSGASLFAQFNEKSPLAGAWDMGISEERRDHTRVYSFRQTGANSTVIDVTFYKVINGRYTPGELAPFSLNARCTGQTTIRCEVPYERVTRSFRRETRTMSLDECRRRMGTNGISPKDRGYSDMGCTGMSTTVDVPVQSKTEWTNVWTLVLSGNSLTTDIAINDPQDRRNVRRTGSRIVTR